jgi:hypothetical protein
LQQRVLHVTETLAIYFTDGSRTTEVHHLKDFAACEVDSDGRRFTMEYHGWFGRSSVEFRMEEGSTHFAVLLEAMAKRRGVSVQHAYVLGPARHEREKVQLKVGSLMFRIEKAMTVDAAFALHSFLCPDMVQDMEEFRVLADSRRVDIVGDRVKAADFVALLQYDMSTDCSSASSSMGDASNEDSP